MAPTHIEYSFCNLIDQLAQPMCVFEPSGHIVKANPSFYDLFNYAHHSTLPNLFGMVSLIEEEMRTPQRTKMLFDKVVLVEGRIKLPINILLGQLQEDGLFYAVITDLSVRDQEKLSSSNLQNVKQLLTSREYDVVQEIALGKSNKEIAAYLRLKEGTVKVHLRTIMKKLNLKNRTQLAMHTHNLSQKKHTVSML